MRSRPAQAHGASSMLLPHGPKTLLPNNFHLASLVATLTPICRFLRDAWMRSRPAQARSAAQRSSFTDSSVSLPRPAQADGCARGRHRRTALLRCYSLTDQKLFLPKNFHLASLVATLTPICRFLRGAWMRSRPAQAHSAAQSSSSIRLPHGPNSSSE